MRWWPLVLLVVGCIDSRSHLCGDTVCPSASTCDEATSKCIPPGCGDGVVNNNEQCDGADLGAVTDCTSFDFYTSNPVTCSVDCRYNLDACEQKCGDHEINGPELCDGQPAAGYSCLDFGYGTGRVACSNSCTPAFDSCVSLSLSLEFTDVFSLHAIDGRAPNDAFAVGGMGQILHFDGKTWTPSTPSSFATASVYQGLWIDKSTGEAVAVGQGGVSGAAVAIFDGQQWAELQLPPDPFPPLQSVWGRSAKDFWVVGGVGNDSGYVRHFANGAWEAPVTVTTPAPLFGISGDPATGHAVAVGSKQSTGVFDGTSWVFSTDKCGNDCAGGQNYQLQDVYAISPPMGSTIPEYIAVGTSPQGLPAVVAHSLDGGVTWSSLHQPLGTTTLTTISGVRGDLYIGGTSGVLLRYDGRTFHQISTNAVRSIGGIWRAAADDVHLTFVVGEIRRLGTAVWADAGHVKYVDGSGNETNPPGFDAVKLAAAATHDGETLLVGNATTLLSSTNGRTWKDLSAGLFTVAHLLTGVWIAPTGEAYVSVGSGGELLYRPINGAFTKITPAPLTAAPVSTGIFGLSANDIYVVGHSASVSHGPGTWMTSTVGADTTIDLNGVWASGPNDIYVVGDKGLLAHSTNGTTWTTIPIPGLTVALTAIWGTGPNDIFAVGSKGTIVHFDGTAWRYQHQGTEDFNGVYGIAVAGHRSTDVFAVGPDSLSHYDGTAWSEMAEPTLFGMQSATALPTDRNDVLFFGTLGTAATLSRAIGTKELRCNDGWDDDRNGLTDCADPACGQDTACQVAGGSCRIVDALACNTSTHGTTFTGIARVDTLPKLAVITDGPEATYRFDATASGMVTLTLTPSDDHPVKSPSLVVTATYAGTPACNLDAPIAAGTTDVSFTAVEGTTYSIIVDEPATDAGDFDLDVTCN